MVALPIASSLSKHDANARLYLNSLKAGYYPQGYLDFDCGKWNHLIYIVQGAFEQAEHNGSIVEALLNSMIASKKYPGLEELLSSSDFEAPRQEVLAPPLALVEQPLQNLKFPALPDSAKLPANLAANACQWLEDYIQYSRLVSPEGYEDFHEACGLWILSTIAARRIKIPFSRKQFTPLMIALVARTSLYAKSNTAEAAIEVLQSAGLRFLLGSDETTPQKLLTDMSGALPKNYGDLAPEKQYWLKQRLSMSAQRGWYYDEFGSLVKAMSKNGGVMQDFKGLLLRLDNCSDMYEYATQSRGTEIIEKPYLALLGSMTPSDIRASAKVFADFWHDGFWARFAFVCPPPDTSLDAPFSLGEIPVPYALSQPLRDWHTRLGMPGISIEEKRDEKGKITGYDVVRGELPQIEIKLAQGVWDAWAWYRSALKEIARNLPTQDLDGSYNRLSIKAIRIAALFASLENNNVIELRHWAKAQEITERWRKSLHELYSQVNSSELQPTLMKRIEDDVLKYVRHLQEQGKPPTVRDLSRYMTQVDVGSIKMAAADLVRHGLLMEDKSGKSPRYAIVQE